MFLVFNSDVLPEDELRLPVNNRAFNYGDGLFETIRYEAGQVWFWADHFARLTAGMAALQLNLPITCTTDTLHLHIQQLLLANGLADQPARIKIQVWRQPGGLYTPATNAAHFLITAQAGHAFAITEKEHIGIYDAFRTMPSPVSAFKTLNALPYVLAGLYKQQQAFDEVILLDPEGHLAECLASNLFWYTHKTLYTPALQTGCINGIIRQQLLRRAPESGITVQEGHYLPRVLLEAEAVFCANAMGIQWLRQTAASVAHADALLNDLFAQFLG